MAEHEPGSMDISVQEKTFAGFMKVCVWTAIVVAIILIFLAFVGT